MTEPAGAGVRRRGDTRERILASALRLFAEHGYAGTSIRDIAQDLSLTKAAVHYHFAAKQQLVVALLQPYLDRYVGLLDARSGGAGDPAGLLRAVGDLLQVSGPLLAALAGDPAAAECTTELHADVKDLARRTAEVLAGPAPSRDRLLRASCALGAFLAGWDAAAGASKGDAGTGDAGAGDAGATAVPGPDLDVVLLAALAALGD